MIDFDIDKVDVEEKPIYVDREERIGTGSGSIVFNMPYGWGWGKNVLSTGEYIIPGIQLK